MKNGEWDKEWEIPNSPRKKMLRENADTVAVKQCVAELIDNCIDYWKYKYSKKESRPPLKIWIKLIRDKAVKEEPKPIKQFEIKWNMSIPEERLKDILTLGCESLEEEGIIGLWGLGAKIAMHGLARGWELNTFEGKKEIRVFCPPTWIFEEENWKLRAKKRHNREEEKNESYFLTTKLHPQKWIEEKKDEQFYDETRNILIDEEMREHISTRYTEFGEMGVQIYLNGDPIELISIKNKNSIKRNFLWIPGFEPHIDDWGDIKCPNGRNLRVQIFVGMHRNPSQYEAGVYLYGNDRLFLKAAKKAPLFKSYSPKDVNMRLHVRLYGDSKDIPWGIPEKDGLTETHYVIRDLARFIKQSYEPYSQIVTLKSEERYLYTLEGDVSKLVEKAGYTGKKAENMIKYLTNLRELNERELQLFFERRGKGGKYGVECLQRNFRTHIHQLMKDAKDDENYFNFHMGLVKKVMQRTTLLKGIEFEPEKEKVEREELKGIGIKEEETKGEGKEEGEDEFAKTWKQSTLDDFDSSLDKLGEATNIKNKDILMTKVSGAVRKMARELSKKGYTTAKKKIIEELLDIN